MNKLTTRIALLVFVIVFAFSATASASQSVSVVQKGGIYYNTISAGDGQAYILPNASTTGTSVTITSSVAGTIKGHFEWQLSSGSPIQLNAFTANATTYNTGSAYYSPGTLVLVLERVADTTGAYPNVSYTVQFN
ncbi:hypothetical protein DFQ01_105262 [Paenibacillus cellulosilyticus]|uniref:Uncharacterized protein n=1 Tax=Paenibacillus cellulosilyticus TaxID=375489 RepID=A0A2V2YVM2_9BACL|nr:hypothetical protein [Paenibacillus cellulosilyticus]PWW05277.1 hypothetical protein DFQ01_105262 [Paenibacillus cellulosilyticus]QKS43600.1 hypothetical protein HUB94_03440 [Paenibacillus cellulosilyticus]